MTIVVKFKWQQVESLANWLSVHLQTKWLWVRIQLVSLKLQMWRLLRARRSLTCRLTIECRVTLKIVRDIIITYSQCSWTLNSFAIKAKPAILGLLILFWRLYQSELCCRKCTIYSDAETYFLPNNWQTLR